MSDTSTQVGASASTEAPAGTAPASEPVQQLGGGQEHTQMSDTTQQAETFSREYVEELRRENAKHRTAVKEYEEAFAGYDDNSRTTLLGIARQLADPTTQPDAAKRLQGIAENIMKAQGEGKATRPDGEEDPDQRPMTRAEWKAEQARLQEDAARDAAIADIENTSKALGIEPGSPDYALLLLFAQEPEVSGDLNKAKERLDRHYADKAKAEAEAHAARGERWPGVPGTAAGQAGGTGPADVEGGHPKSWKDARQGALAYLRARAGTTT